MKKEQALKSVNVILTEIFDCESFLMAAKNLKRAADRESRDVESAKLSAAIAATIRRRNTNIVSLKYRSLTPKQTNQLIDVLGNSQFKFSPTAQQSINGIKNR